MKIGIMSFYPTTTDYKKEIDILIETASKLSRFVDNIVLVDDGSKLLKTAFFKDKNVTLVKVRHNSGQSEAVRIALKKALKKFPKSEEFVQIDYDRDQSPLDVPLLFGALKKQRADLVVGDRYSPHKKIPKYRKNILALQAAICKNLGFEIRDCTSGIRVFNKRFAKELLSQSRSQTVGLSVEEIIIAYLSGKKATSIPLTQSRLRTPQTARWKLFETVKESFFVHKQRLGNKQPKLMSFLKELAEQIKKGKRNIKVDLTKIGGKETFYFRKTKKFGIEQYTVK